MSKENPTYYAIITASVRYDETLSPNSKLLYAEITALSESSGICWASDSYFMKLYKVTRRTIQNWLKELEDRGYIKREVIYKANSKEIEKRYITLVNINAQGYGKNMHKGMENKCTDNTTSINTTSINNNPIVPLEKEQRFNEFWDAYPKKVNKKRAMTAYNKISKKTHDIIIKDLETRVDSDQWKKDKGKYIPNPTTYLNGERWNDEVEVKESVYRVHATLT